MDKPFKLVSDQISILESRGIQINNHSEAETFLIRRNYYSMINGYSRFFEKTSDVYLSGTTLREIEKVYIFDKAMKGILYSHIMEVEKYLKAILSYYFCIEHPNPSDYTNTGSYLFSTQSQREKTLELINNIQSVITDYSSKRTNNAIKYYMNTYGFVPLWVLIQYMYFGDVILMFECCEPRIQNKISREFADFMHQNTGNDKAPLFGADLLEIFKHMKTIRNAVAHDNNLFFYKSGFSIPFILPVHQPLGIASNKTKNDVYQTVVIMKCLVSPTEYTHLQKSIARRFKDLKRCMKLIDYTNVTTALGFPADWLDTI